MEASPPQRSDLISKLCVDSPEAHREVKRMLIHADVDIGVESEPGSDQQISLTDPEKGLRRIDRFEIVEPVGQGATGVVYHAIDTLTGKPVAVKLLRLSIASERTARRLEFEGELLSKLLHESIARVYTVSSIETEFGRLPFIAMELVHGEPIDQFVRSRKLDQSSCIELMIKVCDAMAYAHRLGIIHRDLKPANILVNAEGNPKVLDFGIARDSENHIDPTNRATQTGDLLGTPGYMSPEQCAGNSDLADTRADVYALGIIFFELLSGERLFATHGLPLREALSIMARAEAPLISTYQPHLRGDIEAIIAKAMGKNPRRRYDSASALADDLQRFLDGQTVTAPPVSRRYLARRFIRRHRYIIFAFMTITVLLMAALGWQWNKSHVFDIRAQAIASAMSSVMINDVTQALDSEKVFSRLVPDAQLSQSELVTHHDFIGVTFARKFRDSPEALVVAVDHLGKAFALTRNIFGREDQRSIRALQVYAETMCMAGQSQDVFSELQDELEYWEFTPEMLSRSSDISINNRLLRLASTYGEAMGRIGRYDRAIAYLKRVRTAQQKFFGDLSDVHTDAGDTLTLINFITKLRDQSQGD